MQSICKFVLFGIVMLTVLAVNVLAAPSLANLVLGTVESALKAPLALVEAVAAGGAV